jgi:glycogen phosphorylase
MSSRPFDRALPEELADLADLALDLRWMGSRLAGRIWERLDAETWERTKNPYILLLTTPQARLEEAARDEQLKGQLRDWVGRRKHSLESAGWFHSTHPDSSLKTVAYFSMEFGLSEALPIYSGGLGMLAGDHLKSASDLGVPLVGVGLLYQQGYFRQVLADDGRQLEAFPYNDPGSLPVSPVHDRDGSRVRVGLDLPGRTLLLRVWEARVGRVPLYLLDSNDPLNSPWDRAITANLYAAGRETRLLQELVLGVGGWRLLEQLGVDVQVCHLNEGHAAFAVMARAASFADRTGLPFLPALWATRAGNVFTTHTPVAAAFDQFEPDLLARYAQPFLERTRIPLEHVVALGRKDPSDRGEPFNMAHLAMRGCCHVNGVSRLHGRVSRGLFKDLYPAWPEAEIPVGHVTNGVHVPTWDSAAARRLWNTAFGAADHPWVDDLAEAAQRVARLGPAELWDFRAEARRGLIDYVRRRLARQYQEHGAPAATVERARRILDPNTLTLGFARRFTEYKRPTLLLRDPERLARLLTRADRPAQLIVAGKAHPNDEPGKAMVQALARFARREDVWDRVAFLEDYDMALSQVLAAGVDVWLNTPRRPMEACGTSGMKMLVNGGLNFSSSDGWWDEAFAPDVGWAVGDGREPAGPEGDARDALRVYEVLEAKIIPEFYDRDAGGMPQAWVARIRASMSRLTPRFSSDRMLREYVAKAYLPAAEAYRRRAVGGGELAAALHRWQTDVAAAWRDVCFGDLRVTPDGGHWLFEAAVSLGGLSPGLVRVQLYAEPTDGEAPAPVVMDLKGPVPGSVDGYYYTAKAPADRPARHYTPRIVPHHPDALVPLEDGHIRWRRG